MGRQGRPFPRIAASGLLAAALLVVAAMVAGRQEGSKSSVSHSAAGPNSGAQRAANPSFTSVVPESRAFSVQAAGWYAGGNTVSIGYSVSPADGSSTGIYRLLSPRLYQNGKQFPSESCFSSSTAPPSGDDPTARYQTTLCFAVPDVNRNSRLGRFFLLFRRHRRCRPDPGYGPDLPGVTNACRRVPLQVHWGRSRSARVRVVAAPVLAARCPAPVRNCNLRLTLRVMHRVFAFSK